MPEITYLKEIPIENENTYDEVVHFFDQLAIGGKEYIKDEDKTYYYFNEEKDKVARTNMKGGTVELSDKVEGWVIRSVNRLKEQTR